MKINYFGMFWGIGFVWLMGVVSGALITWYILTDRKYWKPKKKKRSGK